MRVLGIDPGSRVTGYGVVEGEGGEIRHVTSGTIRLDASRPMHERLDRLYTELGAVIASSSASAVAVERVFVSRNADSALKLGHARGVILLAMNRAGLPLFEYTPAQVKKTITGRGRADKHQMVSMVKLVLGINGDLAEDAADALAIAMTHVMLSGVKDLLDDYVE